MPLSAADDSILAIANNLCKIMANPYTSDDARMIDFNKEVKSVFEPRRWLSKISMIGRPGATGKLDGALEGFLILREDRAEMDGIVSDPYMRIARGFQAFIRSNLGEGVVGFAAFLLMVVGPVLMVAGGFYDGVSTIVEPLGQPLYMLPDLNEHGRPTAIAKCLSALKNSIQLITNPPPRQIMASIPRIYSEYFEGTGTSIKSKVTLVRRLPRLGDLVFEGRLDTEGRTERCLVKLVYGNYGTQVHRLLAQHGLAPRLFGVQTREGAPTAVAMEYLDLYEAGSGSGGLASGVKTIVDVLSNHNLVHGDLRANNMMVRIGADKSLSFQPGDGDMVVQVKAIDFDWSGESGKVFYPLSRNPELGFPADAGDPILVGHDDTLVTQWWPIMLPEVVYPPNAVPSIL